MSGDIVIGPPGSSNAIMVPVKHVGIRPERTDNVANTGLTWRGDETLLVPEQKAVILLKYPDVWALDADYQDQRSDTKHDESVPLVIHVTTGDFEALASGRASVMVVHASDERSFVRASQESIQIMEALGRDQVDKARSQHEANAAPIAKEGNDHGK